MRGTLFSTAAALAAAIALSADCFAEECFFDSDGVRIHYQIEGEGPPVVLVHGFLATGDLNWRTNGVIQRLAAEHRVVVVDNRGHGKSDQPLSPDAYGEAMAADVVRLMDHLAIEKAHIVGYSMGGMIAIKVCATRPDRVVGAVIGGMGWLPKGPVRARPTPPDLPPAFAAKQACAAAFPALGTTEQEFRAIRVPMTVVVGEEDRLIERVRALESLRPDVPVVRIPGANHVSCIWREEFKEAICKAVERPPDADR